ncbi:hypothetical protein SEA_BOYNAMEDSUE_31 [Gordonia phage BoyNamedSue]|uniref:Minor tail protein n=1 Tax=Gordonia phage BoyNamedSue TaxID=2836009 RepID=A0A8F3IKM5_9CAUD|nr:hypothetical protein PP491_gp31 [Gordonia phage BoyNamedSue]QWY79492.1 hypothetical protein SEA_BOYNAMEDSUE_31 [Gordonia phage BoyNamedSue]QYW01057.1 hypothetical protein SEA_ALUME_31 [Gordonia phage AlumE]
MTNNIIREPLRVEITAPTTGALSFRYTQLPRGFDVNALVNESTDSNGDPVLRFEFISGQGDEDPEPFDIRDFVGGFRAFSSGSPSPLLEEDSILSDGPAQFVQLASGALFYLQKILTAVPNAIASIDWLTNDPGLKMPTKMWRQDSNGDFTDLFYDA